MRVSGIVIISVEYTIVKRLREFFTCAMVIGVAIAVLRRAGLFIRVVLTPRWVSRLGQGCDVKARGQASGRGIIFLQ